MTLTKNVLAVHDISCVGRCSLTVALPIISAFGVETRVLPTGLLSTHTGGFTGYTFLDLTDEMRKIIAAWEPLELQFDAIYSGYLGTAEQIDIVKSLSDAHSEALTVVDPVMADDGKLYPGFDAAFVKEMARLIPVSSVLTPNVTEAALLTGIPYQEEHDDAFVKRLFDGLTALGAREIVMTGVRQADQIGAVTRDGSVFRPLIGGSYHGTGDIFGSVLTAELVRGLTTLEATEKAVDFVIASIRATPDTADKRFGVNFEEVLADGKR